ncbi:MAG TPA: serine protease [Acidimicrobiales bacterium]|jgi:S1-C subfamily serine protease|nr:serine protease [Acidimicrobiales bacterium]
MATLTRRRSGSDAEGDLYDQERAWRPPPWRERLVPKTILGMTMLILSTAIGAAFSGAVLYAYYDYRLSQNEKRIESFTAGFDERFKTATETIAAEREAAKAEVRKELEPIKKIRAEGETLEELIEKASPSVWFVNTLDEAGQPSVGSAFVVASDSQQTLMITSFNTVRAATRQPGPAVNVRKGDEQIRATLHTWQEEKDLALLIIGKGNLPKLQFAPSDPPLKIGQRVFSLSGLGSKGGAISQGFVADVSSAGIQHDASIGTSFQGGPLLNDKGEVLAVASRAYAPLGFTTDDVFFGVPVRAACEKVLRCPDGGDPSAGNR